MNKIVIFFDSAKSIRQKNRVVNMTQGDHNACAFTMELSDAWKGLTPYLYIAYSNENGKENIRMVKVPEDGYKISNEYTAYSDKIIIRAALINDDGEVKAYSANEIKFSLAKKFSTTDPTQGDYKPIWVRDPSRPPLPDPAFGDNTIYMLFGVQSHMPNDMAFLVQTSQAGTDYTVDWGDGTIETVTRNVKCEHIYDFNAINAPVNKDGIKWVWIHVTSNGPADFSVFNMIQRHSQRPANASSAIICQQVYEIYLKASRLTSIPFASTSYTRYHLLEVFDYQGSNLMTSMDHFLAESRNLVIFNMDTSNVATYTSTLNNCTALKGINGGFDGSGEWNVSGATTLASFLVGNNNWQQKIVGDTSKCTSFATFASGWSMYRNEFNLDTSAATTLASAFTSLSSYTGTITVDLKSTTTALSSSFFSTANRNVTGLRLLNMGTLHSTVVITNSLLNRNAIVALFGDLPNRIGLTPGTITITGCLGVNDLTEDDVKIATDLGWTVVR